MGESEILKYINNPALIAECDMKQLKYLVYNFPYFQTAHILYLKALLIQDKEQFENQLPKSSSYISDRDLLFKFLNTNFEIEKEDIEQDLQEKEEEIPENKKLLKNKNVKRRINNSFEGMGENISETISSQIAISSEKDSDKLEYPSEIYFIEEERDGKNNIITIDAVPENIKKQKDILQMDEEELSKRREKAETKSSSKQEEEPFELIETDDVKNPMEEKSRKYFNISDYDDNDQEPIQDDLISKFIKENPRIETKEVKEEIEDISQDSVKDNSNLLSETLIKVYIKQGLFEKAIESYKKLSLKYPEKNTYFASQIKILEEKINNQ